MALRRRTIRKFRRWRVQTAHRKSWFCKVFDDTVDRVLCGNRERVCVDDIEEIDIGLTDEELNSAELNQMFEVRCAAALWLQRSASCRSNSSAASMRCLLCSGDPRCPPLLLSCANFGTFPHFFGSFNPSRAVVSPMLFGRDHAPSLRRHRRCARAVAAP